MLTPETLTFLRHLVATIHLDVAAPDFLVLAQTVAQALAELDEALAEPFPRSS